MPGELIVRNGKQRGARLPLRHPATVIGSADGCDVRLTADGIGPVHCLIVLTPDGPALRSWHPTATRVNGIARAECPLADGDEVRVGPCLFRLSWAADDPAAPPPESLPAEAGQLADHFDDRARQLAEREEQLALARAAFRRERDEIRTIREDADRLRREAKALHTEAARERDRVRRLAGRFLRRHRQRWAEARRQLNAERAAVEAARHRLSAEERDLGAARSDFHAGAAEERDRLRNEWAALDAQRRRAADEWAEANDYFAKQDALLNARAAELSAREKALGSAKRETEKETAALRAEAAGLETRIRHARAAVEELERKRERLVAAVLTPAPAPAPEPPGARVALDRNSDRDLLAWAAELEAWERKLGQDRAALAAVKAGLDAEAADLADRRRVVAEQLALLAGARSQWQDAERRTVAEMEELARGLGRREQELDAREQRLFRADARRRQDAYDLWQFRLRLEAWQSKLLTVEARWHVLREQAEAELAGREQAQERRESLVLELFGRWEHERAGERERLRAELELWAADRARMLEAAAGYDRQREEVLAELVAHAARALAAEQLVAGAIADSGSPRVARRLEVLRKRWERVFAGKLREIDDRRSAAAAERARLEERYCELHRLLADVTEREGALNDRLAQAEAEVFAAQMAALGAAAPTVPERVESAELRLLREEVERMANVLLDAEYPEPPDSELPWGAEETTGDRDDVLPFTRAA
jgi:chromosome segregation ATPase